MTPDEKAKIGFDAAIKLITYEGALMWSTFRTMIAMQTFLVGVGGIFLKFVPGRSSVAVSIIVGFLGLILCLIWFVVTVRQATYYSYWFAHARALEKKYLGPEIAIITEGRRFADGETPEIDLTDGSKAPRMAGLSRITDLPPPLRRWLEFGFQLDELTAGLSFYLRYLVI